MGRTIRLEDLSDPAGAHLPLRCCMRVMEPPLLKLHQMTALARVPPSGTPISTTYVLKEVLPV